jgi:hypothetical protein
MVWTSRSFRVFQRAGIAFGHAAQHLGFALGTKYGGIRFSLNVAHFLGQGGAAGEQLEQLRIDGVDLLAQRS